MSTYSYFFSTVALLLPLFYISNVSCSSTDLTIVPGTSGAEVVVASLAKITDSLIFSKDDHQVLRRIAYVETMDGLDNATYSGSDNNGGIWQLSEEKYEVTKEQTDASILQEIQDIFRIDWNNTVWADLRKPFYSALASRLYLELVLSDPPTEPYPISTNIPLQGQFWLQVFTSSDKTEADYAAGAIELNEAERCEIGALDVFYLLDDSESLGEDNFIITRQFLRNMTEAFPVAPDRVRIGLITFAYDIDFRFFLNTYDTKEDVLAAIDATNYTAGGTNTSGALDEVRLNGFLESEGARASTLGVPRIAIVVTDGRSFRPNETAIAAEQLHNDSVIVYALGIAEADPDELNAIASSERFAVDVATFDESILSAVQVSLSRLACEASQSLSTDDFIETSVKKNETKFIAYPLPTTDSGGLTFRVNSTDRNCSVIIYGSTFITTPNAAFHDFSLSTSTYEDIFIDRSNLFNPETATRMYLSIMSGDDSPDCNVRIDAQEGDTTTEPVKVISEFPPVISKVVDSDVDVVCIATGNPIPEIQWYVNDTLIGSSCSNCESTPSVVNQTVLSSQLRIDSVSVSNEGVYTCSASNVNPGGTTTDSASFRLNVLSFEEACPIKGSEQCDDRIILAGCQYLSTVLDANDIPLPCQERLKYY